MTVTAETIARASLFYLLRHSLDADVVRAAVVALGLIAASESDRSEARTRCATAWKARLDGALEAAIRRGAEPAPAPYRVSDVVLADIARALAENTGRTVGPDMDLDEGRALVAELQARRAADLADPEMAALIRAATGGRLTADGERALDKLRKARGGSPDAPGGAS